MQPELSQRADTKVQNAPQTKTKADVETPKGTFAIVLMFAALMVVLWGFMYVTMLLRG